jgi:hypothetical protein
MVSASSVGSEANWENYATTAYRMLVLKQKQVMINMSEDMRIKLPNQGFNHGSMTHWRQLKERFMATLFAEEYGNVMGKDGDGGEEAMVKFEWKLVPRSSSQLCTRYTNIVTAGLKYNQTITCLDEN